MGSSRLRPKNIMEVGGVEYSVPLSLDLHSSFFFPTLTPKVASAAIAKHYSKHKYKFIWAEQIQNGVLGIRVWRTI